MDLMNIFAQVQDVAGSLILICTGVIGIAMIIPGEQPEKALQSVVDFLKKFSKK